MLDVEPTLLTGFWGPTSINNGSKAPGWLLASLFARVYCSY